MKTIASNMRLPAFDTQLKRPALYNPGLWSAAEVRAYYIARTSLFDRLLDDIRRETPGSQPQHRLIVGQRGMGKSTLLRRLAIGVEDDAQLESQWLPLIFPEEQYNVTNLADFWLNCLDALGDLHEARGDHAQAAAIDREVEQLDRSDSEGALQALLRIAGKQQRRLLLLVDNIDLILDRIKSQDWALREVLQGHPEIMLIGASSRALEASYDYGAAFYDFFKIDELRGLSLEEMRETILTLARLRGAGDVIERIASDPGRLPVLHTLTGGNPRTAVLLYGVLLKGVDGDVRSDLEALLDEVTPLYKARFDELPTQAQQLLDKLALNWDPITARGLADLLGWQVNLVSAQLDRLSASGVVEKVKFGKGKRIAFQVSERFFNIWYLMRASRRVRRKLMWLVEFLRVFFSSDELQNLAKQRLSTCPTDEKEAEYTLAISRALGKLPLARALETQALDTLLSGKWRGRIEEMLDLRGEDSHLASKVERIKARKEAGLLLEPLLASQQDKTLLQQFLGLPIPGEALLQMARRVSEGDAGELIGLREYVEDSTKQMVLWFGRTTFTKLHTAFAAGDMDSVQDKEGGEAAALRYDYPLLAQIPRMIECLSGSYHVAEHEQLARQALEGDSNGVMYLSYLTWSLARQKRFVEAQPFARRLCEADPNRASHWRLKATVLINTTDAADEQLEAARRALSMDLTSELSAFILAISLLVRGNHDEGLQVSRRWLTWLAVQASPGGDEFTDLILLVQVAISHVRSVEMLTILDETEAGQRFRPVREALAAVVAGTADILNSVAPEVRKPALEILALIAPNLLKDAP